MYTIDETKPRDLSAIEKPAVSVTLLIFSVNKNNLEVLLIKRVREPYLGFWSLPGDILDINETLETAARDVLHDKTGMSDVYLEQLFTFGNPKRDPRGRVIAISYFALIPESNLDASKVPSELHAKWTPITELPEKLAFDHNEIIKFGIERLRDKLENSTIAHGLLPEKFRLTELQNIYEIILEKKIDKRNFRKKMNSLNIIEPTKEVYRLGKHRPAQLYKFSSSGLVKFK